MIGPKKTYLLPPRRHWWREGRRDATFRAAYDAAYHADRRKTFEASVEAARGTWRIAQHDQQQAAEWDGNWDSHVPDDAAFDAYDLAIVAAHAALNDIPKETS